MNLCDPRLFDPHLFDTGAAVTNAPEQWTGMVAVRRTVTSPAVAVQCGAVITTVTARTAALAVTVER